MTNDTQKHNIAKIRKLLLAAFTPEELRRFCHDRPTFRPITNRFGQPYRLDDMVDGLITYCENYLLCPELLAELKQLNPRQYARFIEPELSDDEPAPATPALALSASDRDTISHPISLHLIPRPPPSPLERSTGSSRACPPRPLVVEWRREKALRGSTIQGTGRTDATGLRASILAPASRARQPPGARTAFPLAATQNRAGPPSKSARPTAKNATL